MNTGVIIRYSYAQVMSRRMKHGYSIVLRYTKDGKQAYLTIGFVPDGDDEAKERVLEQAKMLAKRVDDSLFEQKSIEILNRVK